MLVEIFLFCECVYLYVRTMEGLNDVNLKRGIDDSYSRLKTKVQ
jgi:hypothetical protein